MRGTAGDNRAAPAIALGVGVPKTRGALQGQEIAARTSEAFPGWAVMAR